MSVGYVITSEIETTNAIFDHIYTQISGISGVTAKKYDAASEDAIAQILSSADLPLVAMIYGGSQYRLDNAVRRLMTFFIVCIPELRADRATTGSEARDLLDDVLAAVDGQSVGGASIVADNDRPFEHENGELGFLVEFQVYDS